MRDRGYQVAEALGLQATRQFQDGEDGSVYQLADGRILKITDSETEAAICLALQELQDQGEGHPSVPRVDHVMWLEDEDNEPDEIHGGQPYYVIIREDFTDVSLIEIDEEIWKDDLWRLHEAWKSPNPARMARALPQFEPCRTPALQILEGLRWVRGHIGVTLHDIKADNVGVGLSGHAGLRDLSRAQVPRDFLERVSLQQFMQCPRLGERQLETAAAYSPR